MDGKGTLSSCLAASTTSLWSSGMVRIDRRADFSACAPLQTKACGPDIISVLLEPWREKKPTGLEMDLLEGDAQLIVAAGRYSSSLAPRSPIAVGRG